MNKRGFTLVELLGVIVVLSVILLIAIPNISGVIERAKKDSYINDTKKLVYLVKTEVKSGTIEKPQTGDIVKVTLGDLETTDIEKDKDGNIYDQSKSYIYITRENGNIVYYAQLLALKKNNKYRGILLTSLEELEDKTRYEKYYENVDVVDDITPQEMNENKKFEVGIATSKTEASSKSIMIGYGKTKDVVVTPNSGYYLSSASCTNGYTVEVETGVSKTESQVAIIKNNNRNSQSTCTFVSKKIVYKADIETEHTNTTKESVEMKFGGTVSLDVTPNSGYYLASAECTNDYTIDAIVGIEAQSKQTISINNNRVKDVSVCTLVSLRAYPVVEGESKVWTTGSRDFTIKSPTPSHLITRYEYYVSNSNVKPTREETPTGRFTGKEVTVEESGKYIYFRIIYATGVVSDWTSAKDLYVDSGTLAKPTVIGGDTTLALSRTFLVLSPESTSGVSEYQYYVSDSAIKPSRTATPTQSVLTPTMNVTTTGTYIFFRVINNAGIKSEWTDAINLYVDSNTYTITYNLNGGEQADNAKTKYNVETETFGLPTPTRTGYHFRGWYENSSFSGNSVEEIVTGTTGNKTLYAKWEAKVYTIRYNTYGGTLPDNALTEYTIETNTFNLPTPTKDGSEFTNWYENDEDNIVTKVEKGTTGNKVFSVKWQTKTYTITLNKQNGTGGTNSVTAKFDAALSKITPPTRTGYIFAGYYFLNGISETKYYDENGNGVLTWNIARNENLYAKWNPITYKIKFNANGGEGSISNQTFTYDVEQVLTENSFTKSIYIFAGWATSPDAIEITYTDKQKVSNLTTTNNKIINLYAVWLKPEPYEFAYNGTNGTDGFIQTFTAPIAGYYKLEAWGAQRGGYSTGVVKLTNSQNLYIAVGGQGTGGAGYIYNVATTSSGGTGGYNGGGNGGSGGWFSGGGYTCTGGQAGGGATHIATVNLGVLANYASNKSEVLIVAGGGGTDGWNNNVGGYGGGYQSSTPYSGVGIATQTSGCDFGRGCNGSNSQTEGGPGGGGGWYGGYGSGHANTGASGGSGYIGSSKLLSSYNVTKHMYCYNCGSNQTAESIRTIVGTCIKDAATADCAKSGHGYARITYLGQ